MNHSIRKSLRPWGTFPGEQRPKARVLAVPRVPETEAVGHSSLCERHGTTNGQGTAQERIRLNGDAPSAIAPPLREAPSRSHAAFLSLSPRDEWQKKPRDFPSLRSVTGSLKERLAQLLEQKCAEKGWDILELAIQPDHLHLFVRVWPSDSAAEVVKELKGFSSFHLRKEFAPILSKLPSLWTRSYFSSTAGNVSAETIQRYIQAQKGV